MGAANCLNLNQSGLVKFDGTVTFSGTSITNHNIIVGSTSNNVTNIAPSTAGSLLLSGGASANPSAVLPTNGSNTIVTANATTNSIGIASGWVWIATKNVSSVADVQFISEISSTYDNYVLFMSNVTLATGSTQNLLLEVSSNGGSTWINSGYQSNCSIYVYNSFAAGSSGRSQASLTANIPIMNVATSETVSAILDIWCLTSGNLPSFSGWTGLAGATGYQGIPNGRYLTNTAMNAFRVRFDSNNIGTGIFTLFGVL